jgi:hypothetical protein
VIGVGLLTYGYFKTGGGNLLVTGIFTFFLISIFFTAYASNKLNYLTNLSYILKITDNSSDPLQVTRVNNTQSFYKYLENNDFVKYKNDSSHYLFYRVTKDKIKQMFSKYMMEVIVYVNKDEPDFYLDKVNQEINDLKDKFLAEKQIINKLFITQYKEVDELDEKTKKDISEIVFIRTKHNIVSTINVGIFKSELAVMLYSDTYTPSLYYTYHINQIKDMI